MKVHPNEKPNMFFSRTLGVFDFISWSQGVKEGHHLQPIYSFLVLTFIIVAVSIRWIPPIPSLEAQRSQECFHWWSSRPLLLWATINKGGNQIKEKGSWEWGTSRNCELCQWSCFMLPVFCFWNLSKPNKNPSGKLWLDTNGNKTLRV